MQIARSLLDLVIGEATNEISFGAGIAVGPSHSLSSKVDANAKLKDGERGSTFREQKSCSGMGTECGR